MSHEGKLARGEKWYNTRTVDGLVEGVKNDPGKMVDVEYYLKDKKSKEEKEKTNSKSKKEN